MLIGSKLPPHRVNKTYFNTGRAAFAYLIGEIVKPCKVYLPTFVCWSLVSTMEKRFAEKKVEFYAVDRNLKCDYPAEVEADAALVFIHYFGHQNINPLPTIQGRLLEDMSHSHMSKIKTVGDYVFGSFRKILKVGDGGFIDGFYNPMYEPSRRLDTWLRYEAEDWRDVREAENMLDRDWSICDISSQSLAIMLQANEDLISNKRRANEQFLTEHIRVGKPLLKFRSTECPMIHNRLMESRGSRDSLRQFLSGKGIFTSIHWPTHPRVLKSRNTVDISETLWLEEHILSIPVSDDYSCNDMEFICDRIAEWEKAGA
jgi:dTDP-4-amino-4,6-dideoxygalactose transaminase